MTSCYETHIAANGHGLMGTEMKIGDADVGEPRGWMEDRHNSTSAPGRDVTMERHAPP